MNNRVAKKLRKEARRAAIEKVEQMGIHKMNIGYHVLNLQKMQLIDRLKFSYKLIFKRFGDE
jgi:hypothetical protein